MSVLAPKAGISKNNAQWGTRCVFNG